MRSAREIWFRVRQEAANLAMFALPPESGIRPGPPRGLPDPASVVQRLAGTAFAEEVLRLADSVMQHRLPLLGITAVTGPEIAWRRDPVHGTESGDAYFRRIPYLDFQRAGDHKLIWELNRHQHWVLLAQAQLLSGNRKYGAEIRRQWESWSRQNPWLRGINWASALEVAFRALSWLWVDHLTGAGFPDGMRDQWLTGLYRHGRYLERNLSFYFSPNTHLLGEAVALHALGVAYPDWPEAGRWRRTGAAVVREQMRRQVQPDGSHFEQSTYYHLYALDFFLLHAILERAAGGQPPLDYLEKLGCMADFLAAIAGPSRSLPMLGDDDGGRVFHPYGPRDRFSRATLATTACVLNRTDLPAGEEDLAEQACWWLRDTAHSSGRPAEPASRHFPDSGLTVLAAGSVHAIFDAGPFAPGSAGHSHSDTLSLVVRDGAEEILIDPGTYTYNSDPAWRDAFRGSSAHNTVRIDGLDQASPAGPFRWTNPPSVILRESMLSDAEDRVEAECRYGPVVHRRCVVFVKPHCFRILDEVEGPPGEHLVEQVWHPGESAVKLSGRVFGLGQHTTLLLDERVEARLEEAWKSPVHGQKIPAPVIVAVWRGVLPLRLETKLMLGAPPSVIGLVDK